MSREASALTVSNLFTAASAIFASNAAVGTFRDRPIPAPPLRPAPRILSETQVQLLGSSIRVSAVIRSVPSFKLPLLQMSSSIPSQFLAPRDLDKP